MPPVFQLNATSSEFVTISGIAKLDGNGAVRLDLDPSLREELPRLQPVYEETKDREQQSSRKSPEIDPRIHPSVQEPLGHARAWMRDEDSVKVASDSTIKLLLEREPGHDLHVVLDAGSCLWRTICIVADSSTAELVDRASAVGLRNSTKVGRGLISP